MYLCTNTDKFLEFADTIMCSKKGNKKIIVSLQVKIYILNVLNYILGLCLVTGQPREKSLDSIKNQI